MKAVLSIQVEEHVMLKMPSLISESNCGVCWWQIVANTSSSSRRSRRSHDLDSVRRMSTTEEQSVQSQQQAQPEAQTPNMSVWTRRVLVRRLDARVAEYVTSFAADCSVSL